MRDNELFYLVLVLIGFGTFAVAMGAATIRGRILARQQMRRSSKHGR